MEEAVGQAVPGFLVLGLVVSVLLLVTNTYMIRALAAEDMRLRKVGSC
jgi:hypothetical protein